MKTFLLRSGMLAGAAALVLVGVSPASAHVGVDSPDAAKGGWATLSFRVPTESETASTTSITVNLPEGTTFAYVATQAKPGWKATQVARKSVTWTAEKGYAIPPGEYDVFGLRVGPMPKDADEVAFPTTQRYSDGTTVAWDQPTPESGEEPEHPAPVVALAAETSDGHGAHHGAAATDPAAQASSSDDEGVDGWVVGGAVVLALAVGALGASLLRRRSRA